jgi:hypothetical protein
VRRHTGAFSQCAAGKAERHWRSAERAGNTRRLKPVGLVGGADLCWRQFAGLGHADLQPENSPLLDAVIAYGPMAGAYGFSPIGFSGLTCGAGLVPQRGRRGREQSALTSLVRCCSANRQHWRCCCRRGSGSRGMRWPQAPFRSGASMRMTRAAAASRWSARGSLRIAGQGRGKTLTGRALEYTGRGRSVAPPFSLTAGVSLSRVRTRAARRFAKRLLITHAALLLKEDRCLPTRRPQVWGAHSRGRGGRLRAAIGARRARPDLACAA